MGSPVSMVFESEDGELQDYAGTVLSVHSRTGALKILFEDGTELEDISPADPDLRQTVVPSGIPSTHLQTKQLQQAIGGDPSNPYSLHLDALDGNRENVNPPGSFNKDGTPRMLGCQAAVAARVLNLYIEQECPPRADPYGAPMRAQHALDQMVATVNYAFTQVGWEPNYTEQKLLNWMKNMSYKTRLQAKGQLPPSWTKRKSDAAATRYLNGDSGVVSAIQRDTRAGGPSDSDNASGEAAMTTEGQVQQVVDTLVREVARRANQAEKDAKQVESVLNRLLRDIERQANSEEKNSKTVRSTVDWMVNRVTRHVQWGVPLLPPREPAPVVPKVAPSRNPSARRAQQLQSKWKRQWQEQQRQLQRQTQREAHRKREVLDYCLRTSSSNVQHNDAGMPQYD